MKTCEYAGAPFTSARSHPWSGSASDPSAGYHDFTAEPGLIRSSLEDFRAFQRYPAIEAFYALLERLNHPSSSLESNDCAFNGPEPSEGSRANTALECSGRLMVLYRALELNTERARLTWLEAALHQQLAELDPKFSLGIVGTTLVPVRYLKLAEAAQLGQELMLSFWAFGDTEPEVMLNLARLFRNLSRALRLVSARIVQPD